MLKIGNKKHKTGNISNLIEKIRQLPSAFSNIEEDKKIEDMKVLDILKTYPGISSKDVSNDYLKCRKLINDTLNKYQRILPLSQNPSEIMNKIVPLEKMLLSEFQGKVDNNAYMVGQGEVGFSNEEKIGTMNIAGCVCIIARSTESNVTALAHIDLLADDVSLIEKVFQYLPNENKEVILVGARTDINSSRGTLNKVLEAILERVKHGDNINIIKSDILPNSPENGYNAFVVCPKTLTVNYRVPGIKRGLQFDCYPVSRLIVSYDAEPYNQSFEIKHPNGRLDVAFDLTIQKSFFPIEIHYPGPSNFFNFPSKKFLTVTNNEVCINEDIINEFVDHLINTSYDNSRMVFVPGEAIGHLKLKDVAILYKDQLNNVINEISTLPSINIETIEDITKIVTKKRIFIGKGAEKANQKLVTFIKTNLTDLFNYGASLESSLNGFNKFRLALEKFRGDLERHEIPFTTNMKTFNKNIAIECIKGGQLTTNLEIVDNVVPALSSCSISK